MQVAVLGGAGHVGLGMSLVLANAGHNVFAIDVNEERNSEIMDGKMPFYEKQGEEYLKQALAEERLHASSDLSRVEKAEIVICVIGTPIDENMNPRLKNLKELLVNMSRYLNKDNLVILRSTVAPGTTKRIKEILEEETGYKIGKELQLVFAPERVAQGKAIEEMKNLPQLIGAFDSKSYTKAEKFFHTFLKAQVLRLFPIEAEIGKLITNMARYVNFALANEFHLIADSFGANINKIIDACNQNYPRLDLPSPGPNVAGPCLYKDGWFLVQNIPYNELISTAFQINEGMPMQIVRKIETQDNIEKVSILGMTFKANSDDVRNSESFKLKKQLNLAGYDIVSVEPNLDGFESLEEVKDSDAVVLMTPHKEFKDLEKIMDIVKNKDCLYVDIWGFWEDMKYKSKNGYFFGKEVGE